MELQAVADALTGGAVSQGQAKLAEAERAMKIVVVASVTGALMSTIAAILIAFKR